MEANEQGKNVKRYFIYYVFCKLDMKNKFVDYIGLRSSIFICMVNLNSILRIAAICYLL